MNKTKNNNHNDKRNTNISSQMAIKDPNIKKLAEISLEQIEKYKTKYNFDKVEIDYLISIWKKMAPNKVMDLEDWRRSMGVLDLPNVTYFSTQIFRAIDLKADGQLYFEDYLEFVIILTEGTKRQKAGFS